MALTTTNEAESRKTLAAAHADDPDAAYRIAGTTIGSMAVGGGIGSVGGWVGTTIGAAIGGLIGFGISSYESLKK